MGLFPFSDEDKLDSDQFSWFVGLISWIGSEVTKGNVKMCCHIDFSFLNQDFWEINVVIFFKTISYK